MLDSGKSVESVDEKLFHFFDNIKPLPPGLPVSLEREQDISTYTWDIVDVSPLSPHTYILKWISLRNQAFLVLHNFECLVGSGYAQDKINILCLQSSKRRNEHGVAELKSLDRESLREMIQIMIEIIYDLDELIISKYAQRIADNLKIRLKVLWKLCKEYYPSIWKPTSVEDIDADLDFYNLSMHHSLAVVAALGKTFELARLTTELIDLGIMTFAGGHIDAAFDFQHSGVQRELISLYEGNPHWKHWINPVLLHPFPLDCLGQMLHGRPVWVFEQASLPSEPYELYVATTIEALADVWGPVWSIKNRRNAGLIERYDVGGGSIVPWRLDTMEYPEQEQDSRMCHWLGPDEVFRTDAVILSNQSK